MHSVDDEREEGDDVEQQLAQNKVRMPELAKCHVDDVRPEQVARNQFQRQQKHKHIIGYHFLTNHGEKGACGLSEKHQCKIEYIL